MSKIQRLESAHGLREGCEHQVPGAIFTKPIGRTRNVLKTRRTTYRICTIRITLPRSMFVTDVRNLAIGQGANERRVHVEYSMPALVLPSTSKPGTGIIGGHKYQDPFFRQRLGRASLYFRNRRNPELQAFVLASSLKMISTGAATGWSGGSQPAKRQIDQRSR